ncbi:MAG: outer membrane protein transport protein [Nitrospirae bacterium]|nr:outer membrane protein transport protein [Nitrospirota bacterium]
MKQKYLKVFRSIFVSSFVIIAMLCLAGPGYATNGYFAHGYSAKNKALAGAGTALPLDSLAAATNPAGMVFVGNRVDLGLSLFNPNREYTVVGTQSPAPAFGLAPGTVESDSKWFLIPSLGANRMMTDDYSLGVSIFGNGGMNTDYDTGTFNYVNTSLPQETGVDLMQLFIVPTYARKITSKHGFGVSPVLAYQSFKVDGLGILGAQGFSGNSSKLTNNGHDHSFGYGARIGYLGEILPDLYLGASYQTEINMSRFKDYEGLFAEQGEFDIPQNWSAGIAYSPMTSLTLAFDVQKIYYSEVASVGNTLQPNLTASRLGEDSGAGFGWEDMTVYKLGVQWQSDDEWTWRAGYSYGEQPIRDSEVLLNILAPGVIEQHVTAGVTKTIGGNQEVTFTAMHALSNDVSGPNPLDPAQTIELKMDQWEFTAGYAWKF